MNRNELDHRGRSNERDEGGRSRQRDGERERMLGETERGRSDVPRDDEFDRYRPGRGRPDDEGGRNEGLRGGASAMGASAGGRMTDDRERYQSAGEYGRDGQRYGGQADRGPLQSGGQGYGGLNYGSQGYRDDVAGGRGGGGERSGGDGSERGLPSTSDRDRDPGQAWSGNWFGASGSQQPGLGQGGGMARGQYAGRGPKGYQRSDERIREDVCEALTQHGYIDATDIEVQVQGGEVTLTGVAPDRRQKRLAEDAIESLSGVKDVHNQIRVQREQSGLSGGSGNQQSGGASTGVSGRASDSNGAATQTNAAR